MNLLRERVEWDGIERTLAEAATGALVLVDGDLRPDPRLPLDWVTELLADATARGITVVGITKHTSLARGGAPLIGQLEAEADARLGSRVALVGANRTQLRRARRALHRRRGAP